MKVWLTAFLWLLFTVNATFGQNRVLELNGAGDFVELPSGVLSNVTTATIEAWVNWRSFDGQNKRVFNYGSAWRDKPLGIVSKLQNAVFGSFEPEKERRLGACAMLPRFL